MKENKQAMSEIIGNDALKSRICRDIMNSSLSHAYIIEGPEGSGKHTIALMSAAALACEHKENLSLPLPCLTCPSCKKILERKSPDVIFQGTEGKSTLGVDIARFIKEDVYTIPNDLDKKIYIIEDAEKMTVQAQNALLLTLEEPPSFVHFFLLCDNSSSLLETIKSRAPILRTESVSEEEIDEYISHHDRRAAQMKLSAPEEYKAILKSAHGGIGKAIKLLEPKAWKPVKELRQLADGFMRSAIESRSAKDILYYLPIFSSKRDILSEQLSVLLLAVRDLILLKKSDSPSLCFYCDTDKAIELCDKVSLSFLFSLEEAISNAIDENKRNANVRLMISKMLLTAGLI